MNSELYIKLAAHRVLTILDKQYPLENEVWDLLRMDPSLHDRNKLVEILLIKPGDFAKASFREVISPSMPVMTTVYDRLNNWLAYNNIVGRANHLARWVPTDARVWDAIVTVSKTPINVERDSPACATDILLRDAVSNEFVSGDPAIIEKLNWISEYATQHDGHVSVEWLSPCAGFPAAAVRFCVWDYDEADVWTKKDELVLLTKRAVGFGYDEYFDLLYPTSPLN